jgi:hypothetical protein
MAGLLDPDLDISIERRFAPPCMMAKAGDVGTQIHVIKRDSRLILIAAESLILE